MAQVPVSAIHPVAPDHLGAVALFSAPIDVRAALERVEVDGQALDVHLDELPGGQVFNFLASGVTVLLTPVSGPAALEGATPPHAFHIMMTFFSDMARAGEDMPDPVSDEFAARRRTSMHTLHRVYTAVIRSLMGEEAAVGVARPELGIIYPADVVTGYRIDAADPFLLWIYVPMRAGELVSGRTVGLPLFGHLDLEVKDSHRPREAVYELLANTAGYIISDGATLMPGQTLGTAADESIAIAQGRDGDTPTLRLVY
ncbi:DUF4261 domain-containing protein [Actinotignum schaalii]|uniref:DUF4261 domain-containing protein n=1 Tax=Actinotignum schaalii FB123-CNA-2 TaxID=883067 RepID=S2VK32_9ACTO|nr:DUF4261 domain-containing protein [Actinotignum schaalii]EPD27808.1 hypothetical protein HMPREF9237_00366 [Actinotignum schaalii FB123-CNA-2]